MIELFKNISNFISQKIFKARTPSPSHSPSQHMNSSTETQTPKCAPSNNLNVNFKHFPTAKELYDHIREISKNESKEFVVRNFIAVIEDISIEASTVETELFPKGALEYYTKKNMGWDYTEEETKKWQLELRGGE